MKSIIYLSIVIMVILLVVFAVGVPLYAYGGGHGGSHGGGFRGGHGGGYRGGYRGGYGGGIWIGPGWWDPWWWGFPAYPYDYYDYSEPPVIEQQSPSVQEQQNYWYYCPELKAYYPYVKQCPRGWLKVVPTPRPR